METLTESKSSGLRRAVAALRGLNNMKLSRLRSAATVIRVRGHFSGVVGRTAALVNNQINIYFYFCLLRIFLNSRCSGNKDHLSLAWNNRPWSADAIPLCFPLAFVQPSFPRLSLKYVYALSKSLPTPPEWSLSPVYWVRKYSTLVKSKFTRQMCSNSTKVRFFTFGHAVLFCIFIKRTIAEADGLADGAGLLVVSHAHRKVARVLVNEMAQKIFSDPWRHLSFSEEGRVSLLPRLLYLLCTQLR